MVQESEQMAVDKAQGKAEDKAVDIELGADTRIS